MLPVALRPAAHITADVDRRRKLGRGRSEQPEPMAAKAALEPELHVVEDELRRIAQVVVPRDERVAHVDMRLPQNPLRERRVVAHLSRVEFHARDVQNAVPVAANREARLLQHQLLQAKIEKRQRRPGHHHVHLRQVEQRARRRAGAAAHPESVNDDLGIPAVPAGGDAVDLHRLLQLARKRRDQIVAIVLHPRKHDKANGEQQRAEERHHYDDRDAGDACAPHDGGRRRTGGAGQCARGRHNGR